MPQKPHDALLDDVDQLLAAGPPKAGSDPLLDEVDQLLGAKPGPQTTDRSQWGARPDGSAKGLGFLGVFKTPKGVASEYSFGTTDVDGTERDIPALVPTLTRGEVQSVLDASATGAPLSPTVVQKATAFARTRLQAGKPLFAQDGEQRTDLFPDLPRATVAPERVPPTPQQQVAGQAEAIHRVLSPLWDAIWSAPGFITRRTNALAQYLTEPTTGENALSAEAAAAGGVMHPDAPKTITSADPLSSFIAGAIGGVPTPGAPERPTGGVVSLLSPGNIALTAVGGGEVEALNQAKAALAVGDVAKAAQAARAAHALEIATRVASVGIAADTATNIADIATDPNRTAEQKATDIAMQAPGLAGAILGMRPRVRPELAHAPVREVPLREGVVEPDRSPEPRAPNAALDGEVIPGEAVTPPAPTPPRVDPVVSEADRLLAAGPENVPVGAEADYNGHVVESSPPPVVQPDQPIPAMEDIPGAAARMINEDPDLVRKAEEMRAKGLETKQAIENGKKGRGGGVTSTDPVVAEADQLIAEGPDVHAPDVSIEPLARSEQIEKPAMRSSEAELSNEQVALAPPESRYAGEDLNQLTAATLEEQQRRYNAISHLWERSVQDGVKPATAEALRNDAMKLTSVYEGAFQELAQAGVSDGDIATLRRQIEAGNNPEPTGKESAVPQDTSVAPPTTPASPPPAVTNGAEITHNQRQSSIEIRFPSKPSPEVLDKIKAAGYRWAKSNRTWYKKATRPDEALAAAREMLRTPDVAPSATAGQTAQQPVPEQASASVREPAAAREEPAREPAQRFEPGQEVEYLDDGTWRRTFVTKATDDQGLTQVTHPTLRMQGIIPGAGPNGKALAVGGASSVPAYARPNEIRPVTVPDEIRDIRERNVRQWVGGLNPGEKPVTQAEIDKLRAYDESQVAPAKPEAQNEPHAPAPPAEPPAVQPGDRGALAGAPAEDGGGPREAGTPARSGEPSGRPDRGRGERGGAERNPGTGSDGAVQGTVGVSPERGGDARPASRPAPADFRLSPADVVATGGPKQRLTQNLDAIKTLQAIEADARAATPEEQQILAKYVGWGGLPNVFNEKHATFSRELRELLTDQEYEAARASTPNAHYTSLDVIHSIYQGLERLGLQAPLKVLEPAAGVGHFLGMMPDALLDKASRQAVELDPISARITAALYPSTQVHATGFQDAPLADNSFDLIVSNVPFGNYKVSDPAFKGRPKTLTTAIHNYYFAKALDLVRPGGVVAFITTHYTMDAKDTGVRTYLAERAKLLGAVRLPNTAFKSNAGTEVVTDILFLQKGARSNGHEWIGTKTLEHGHAINDYFIANPRMVLGRHSNTGSMHSDNEYTVEPTGNLVEQLREAMQQLPEAQYERPTTKAATPTKTEDAPVARVPIPAEAREGSWFQDDKGHLFVKQDGVAVSKAALSPADTARAKGLIGIRDALRQTMQAMRSPEATDAQIKGAQKRLTALYDGFVKKQGYIGEKKNWQVLREDPDIFTLQALEEWAPKATKPEKAAIFTKRTLRPHTPVDSVGTPKEALLVALNETGRVDWPRMASLTGQSIEDLQAALDGLVYHDPGTGAWEQADRYLSGNVRGKLKAAQAAAKADAKYRANVEALEKVQPADLEPTDIAVRLGSPWVPAEDIEAFAAHLGLPGLGFRYSQALAKWTRNDRRFNGWYSVQNREQWGTERRNAVDLLTAALNLGDPIVYDTVRDPSGGDKQVVNQKETLAAREKQDKIQDEFRSWIWSETSRATRLARIYNDTMNTMRLWEPDGSHLTLPGMSAGVTLRPHQKNFIWRGLQQPNTLAHHVVGAGKTFAGIALAIEKRRMGLARKPMVVVPNHLVQQWARDVLRLYPAARVLASTKKDFEPANRKRFLNRIATGDWDAVIVPMSHFGMIDVDPETFNEHVRQELAGYEAELRRAREEAGKNDPSVKELEKAKMNLAAKLKDTKESQTKDRDVLTFEQLGVDMLMVDEAHNYKKLGFPTKMTRVAGVPAGPGSQRAFDLAIKAGHVTRSNPTGGTTFLTGTPISNTMAEMYVLMRYLAQAQLKERGIPQFDGWAATFGEKVTAFEISPTGRGFRQKTRFAKFTNLPELVQMYRAFADVQTADMLKLPTPPLKGGKAQVHTVEASDVLDRYVENLLERFAAVLGQDGRAKPDPREDNPLKITTDGRKAALDLRLVGEEQPEGGKVDQVATRLHDIWQRTAKTKGTQLVFADLGTPSKRQKVTDVGGFTVYEALRDRLVDLGIPREQIRFIQEANTDARKQALFDEMNAGNVRVLIGSSETMGAGMNVQQRLVALHHMDAPWRPSDIEQREGRILRQGNLHTEKGSEIYDPNFEVEIHTYVTARSFDAYLWQLLENKARFIQQALKGNTTSRETDDADDIVLNFAQAKGAASGNPAIMEHAKTQSDLQRLEVSEANHDRQKWRLQKELASLPERIEAKEHEIATNQALVDAVTFPPDRKDLSISIDGQALQGTKAAEAIAAKFKQSLDGKRIVVTSNYMQSHPVTIGKVAGVDVKGYFAITTYNDETTTKPRWIIASGDAQMEKQAAIGAGAMTSLAHFLESGPKDALAANQRDLETLRSSLAAAKQEAAKPFAHADKIKTLRARLAELEQALNLDAKSQAEEAAQAGAIVQTAAEEKADREAEKQAEQQEEDDQQAMLALGEGTRTFVQEDVKPAFHAAVEQTKRARMDLRTLFAPDTLSPAAEYSAGAIRANLAARAQRIQRAQKTMRAVEQAMDRWSHDQSRAFWQAVEAGRHEDLDPDTRAIAQQFREILDGRRDELIRLGRLNAYRENYWPHEWAQPGQAKNALRRLFGRRPLQGPESFRKRRTIPTMEDGLALGFEPASWNPTTQFLRKLVEMEKSIAAAHILRDLKRMGTAKYLASGAKLPESISTWVRYPDSFGTVYGPPVVTVKEAYDPELMDGLRDLAERLGVRVSRQTNAGKRGAWGTFSESEQRIITRFAGPEGALMHEIGHAIDSRFDLQSEFGKDATIRQELAALADLRAVGMDITDAERDYLHREDEKIANLVHAFIYAPDRAKAVAPHAYAALEQLAKDEPALKTLTSLQTTRSLKLETNEAEVAVGGAVIAGHYYGPPEVVRLIANHLSPGIRGKSGLFDMYRTAGNFLNQVQLGISAFHMAMTGMESVISKQSAALEALSQGRLREWATLQTQVPVAPIADLIAGHKALKAFYGEDANAAVLDGLIGQIVQGGGGFGWDLFEHAGAPQEFMRALRQGNYPGAALRAIPALAELQMKPVMDLWVPRLKMAAYLDRARLELETLGPEPALEEVRRVLGQAWDSIDNRFGELRYDNLFWHNGLKDLLMASFRAIGWNTGSVRETLTAPQAQLKRLFGGDTRRVNVGLDDETGLPIYEPQAAPRLHPKLAWVISTVMVYGLAGAILMYLMTGKRPSELKDYFFPKTGRRNPDGTEARVSIAGYPKDWYAFAQHPIDTVVHKLQPLMNMIGEILANEDFYGTEIRNPRDPLQQQLQDMGHYVVGEMKPFSLRNYQERGDLGSFVGVTPAPASVNRTPAEREMHEIQQRRGHMTTTREQAEQRNARRTLRNGIAAGTPQGLQQAQEAARSGLLNPRQLMNGMKDAHLSYLQRGIKSLTLEEGLDVYEKASPEERQDLWASMVTKGANAAKNGGGAELGAQLKRLATAAKLPRGPHSTVARAY